MTLFDATSIALLAYLACGIAFSLVFFATLARRLDEDAAKGTLGFRIVTFPGVVALWPLLLRACMRKTEPRERNAHEDAVRCGGQR
jgi:hypothetical protein